MLSRIYLIRHGKTDGNRNHWYYGATDLPLTTEGYDEIKAYAAQGIYPEIPDDAQFFTTGLERTDQTLEAIYGDREHSAITKLQEINFGKAECMTYDELKVFDNFEKWAWDTTGDERIADAETANEFHARIHEGLKELLGKHRLKEWSHRHGGQDAVTVVVCHGGVIACIMEKLFPAVCGSMWDWLPEPGFGYAVDFQDGDPYMYTRINDIGRLGLGLYRLPLKDVAAGKVIGAEEAKSLAGKAVAARIDHKKTRELIDSQMEKGSGYFELEFLGWSEEDGLQSANGGGCDDKRWYAEDKSRTEDVGCAEDGSRSGDSAHKDRRIFISLERKIKAVREALVKRYDRNRYYLTALVDAGRLSELPEMLKKTGAGYFDRVSVSGTERLYGERPEKAELTPEVLADKRIDGPEDEPVESVSHAAEAVWEEIGKFKKAGMIKKAGIAFNGSPSLFDDILKDRQEIDYVELPVNYRMGFSESDLAQKYYTISRRRYKEILVRSPFDGGSLLDLSREMKEALGIVESAEDAGTNDAGTGSIKETLTDPDHELARHTMAGYAMMKKDNAPQTEEDWALRYVLSYPFVVTCIASTGDPEHARENMDAAERFRPLSEEDREKLKNAAGRL